MIDSVLEHPQEIGLTFDEATWQGYSDRYPRAGWQPRRFERSGRGGWVADVQFFTNYRDAERVCNYQRAARMDFIHVLPANQATESLQGAKVAGRAAMWGCDSFAKPTEILRHLKALLALAPGCTSA